MTALTALSLTLTAFVPASVFEDTNTKAYRQLAISIVDALKNESSDKYTELFPSVTEFQKLMEVNGVEYGPYLKEAQDEFAIDYTQNLFPAVYQSFITILQEGKKRGIDWNNVQFARVETSEDLQGSSLSIVITDGKQEYTIMLKKLLRINGQLKVSQFVKLV